MSAATIVPVAQGLYLCDGHLGFAGGKRPANHRTGHADPQRLQPRRHGPAGQVAVPGRPRAERVDQGVPALRYHCSSPSVPRRRERVCKTRRRRATLCFPGRDLSAAIMCTRIGQNGRNSIRDAMNAINPTNDVHEERRKCRRRVCGRNECNQSENDMHEKRRKCRPRVCGRYECNQSQSQVADSTSTSTRPCTSVSRRWLPL